MRPGEASVGDTGGDQCAVAGEGARPCSRRSSASHAGRRLVGFCIRGRGPSATAVFPYAASSAIEPLLAVFLDECHSAAAADCQARHADAAWDPPNFLGSAFGPRVEQAGLRGDAVAIGAEELRPFVGREAVHCNARQGAKCRIESVMAWGFLWRRTACSQRCQSA